MKLKIYKWDDRMWQLWSETQVAPGTTLSKCVAASEHWSVLMGIATQDPAYPTANLQAAKNCPHGWPDGRNCGPCSFDRAFEGQS